MRPGLTPVCRWARRDKYWFRGATQSYKLANADLLLEAVNAVARSILGIVILFGVPSAIWYLISEVFVSDGERQDKAEIRYWEMAYADCIWETGQFDGTKAFLNNHMVSYGRKGRVSLRNYDEKGLYEAERQWWYKAKNAGWGRLLSRVDRWVDNVSFLSR